MSFIPSLPISKIFQPAVSSPKRPSNNQEKVEPTKYYKKIKVISRGENDKTIIRKIDDYHTDRKTYADCHFLINQYDKILEARPIELACSAAETIIINFNSDIKKEHSKKVLKRLLQQLKNNYRIDNKNIKLFSNEIYGKYFVANLGGNNWGINISKKSNGVIENIEIPSNSQGNALDYIINALNKAKDDPFGIAMLMIIGIHGYSITGDAYGQYNMRGDNADTKLYGDELKEALSKIKFMDNSIVFLSSCRAAEKNKYDSYEEKYSYINDLSFVNKFSVIGAEDQSSGHINGQNNYYWSTNYEKNFIESYNGRDIKKLGQYIYTDELFEKAKTNASEYVTNQVMNQDPIHKKIDYKLLPNLPKNF
jgi:hypothetical protein